MNFIVSLFTEKKCFGCQISGHFFCNSCQKNIDIYKPYCYICKKKSQYFSVHKDCQVGFPLRQVIVLTRYRNLGVKKLLRHAKFYSKYKAYHDLIVPNIHFLQNNTLRTDSILVPVPMHFLRKWKRGYNQSEKIAQILSKHLKIPLISGLIHKKKATKQQSHLSQDQRKQNLTGVFCLGSKNVDKTTTIYLVDDVISTGSTLREIAVFLHQQGYNDVRAIVLASD